MVRITGKKIVSDMLWHTLGRKNYARLGRFLWMQSRLDVPNDMWANGELRLQRAFVKEIRGGSRTRVFDVGANVGEWTENVLCQFREEGVDLSEIEMHLFEPASQSYEEAGEKLSPFADATEIRINQQAVADKCGPVSFSMFGETAGTNTLRALPSDTVQKCITVDCTTIDEYCLKLDIDHIDFMKIDTEGNDLNVLRGSESMLHSGKIRYIQFEYNHRWVAFRAFLKDVFDLVLPLGYSIGKVTPKGIEHYRAWHFELESFREGNYMLWRDSTPEGLPILKWWLD